MFIVAETSSSFVVISQALFKSFINGSSKRGLTVFLFVVNELIIS